MCRQLKLISPSSFTIGSVLNLTWTKKPQALVTEQIRAVQSGALAHIPPHPRTSHAQDIKPKPFSDFEFLSGNETRFLS